MTACVEGDTALVQPTKVIVNKARIAIVINLFFIILINITKMTSFGYPLKVLKHYDFRKIVIFHQPKAVKFRLASSY